MDDIIELTEALQVISEELAGVRRIVDELTRHQTELFRALRDHGVLYREIGASAGVTPEAVIRRLNLARKRTQGAA